MSKKNDNFKSLSLDELKKKASTLREELRSIRFKTQGAKSKNVKESLSIRKNIARILTELNSKAKEVVTKKSK